MRSAGAAELGVAQAVHDRSRGPQDRRDRGMAVYGTAPDGVRQHQPYVYGSPRRPQGCRRGLGPAALAGEPRSRAALRGPTRAPRSGDGRAGDGDGERPSERAARRPDGWSLSELGLTGRDRIAEVVRRIEEDLAGPPAGTRRTNQTRPPCTGSYSRRRDRSDSAGSMARTRSTVSPDPALRGRGARSKGRVARGAPGRLPASPRPSSTPSHASPAGPAWRDAAAPGATPASCPGRPRRSPELGVRILDEQEGAALA